MASRVGPGIVDGFGGVQPIPFGIGSVARCHCLGRGLPFGQDDEELVEIRDRGACPGDFHDLGGELFALVRGKGTTTRPAKLVMSGARDAVMRWRPGRWLSVCASPCWSGSGSTIHRRGAKDEGEVPGQVRGAGGAAVGDGGQEPMRQDMQHACSETLCPVSVLLASLTWGFAMIIETDLACPVSLELATPYPSYGAVS